jgi:protein TonB
VTDLHRIGICIAASLVAHFVLARGLDALPPQQRYVDRVVEIRVTNIPDPEPEPPKPPEPKPDPAPQPQVHERARPTAQVAKRSSEPPPPSAPVVDPPPPGAQDDQHFSFDMSGSSSSGGPPVGPGKTPAPVAQPAPGTGTGKPAGGPIAAADVTKMPLPLGRCAGKYTEEATQAGIEGTVVLDVVVDENGRTRDIAVVDGKLGHGLVEAAVAALRACSFTPGEKDGKRVAVRVRAFKITFMLPR